MRILPTTLMFLAFWGILGIAKPTGTQAGTIWYVSPVGNDSNNCVTPNYPCASIEAALQRSLPGDSIRVATGTYTGSGSSVISVDRSLNISGGWNPAFSAQAGLSTLDGQSLRRGVTVISGTIVSLDGFIIENGWDSGAPFGGGVSTAGIVTISNSTIRSSTSGYLGGGIYNCGSLVLINSSVTNNRLIDLNNGASGGGLFTCLYSSTVLSNSVVNNNSSITHGGGIMNYGSLMMTETIVQGNSSEEGGGAIASGPDSTIVVSITNSAILDNITTNAGGGLYIEKGEMYITNSTLANNHATGTQPTGQGGAIFVRGNPKVFVANSTISNNQAAYAGGGVYATDNAPIHFKNSLIAYNKAPLGPDCAGTALTSAGHNLIGTLAGCSLSSADGDQLNIDPELWNTFLGSNWFYPLKPNSPAVDAGESPSCTDFGGNPIVTDQRGAQRSLDGNHDASARCDIGAYELDPNNPVNVHQIGLPVATRQFCYDFLDDFSRPRGWSIGDDDAITADYLNGEYRLRTKQPFLFLFRAPTCPRDRFSVEADLRWAGPTGSDIGLLIGLSADYNNYYFADINTDYQMFAIFQRTPNGFTPIVNPTQTPYIRRWTDVNHLKVSVQGRFITLEINQMLIGTWVNINQEGLSFAGVAAAPYEDAPFADARVDNFRVVTLPYYPSYPTSLGSPSEHLETPLHTAWPTFYYDLALPLIQERQR